MVIKGHVLYVELNNFTNAETGVVTEMTKICYTSERDDADNFRGVAILEAYKPGNYVEELGKFTKSFNMNGKLCRPLLDIEVKEQFTKNGMKFVLKKIDNFDFTKKK